MALANVCHGCLSVDRQLLAVEEHAKLYRQLLLKKSHTNIQKLMMCWECHKILNNIHTFRMKITQAQKLLNNKCLSQHHVLSNLTVTKKIDDYQIIIYEDEKINITPIEIEIEPIIDIKQEDTDPNVDAQLEIKKNELKIKKEYDDLDDANDKEDLDVADAKEDLDDADVKDDFDDADVKDDLDDADNKDDITQLDEILVPIDLLEKKTEIKVEQGRKKRGALKQKYRTIIMDDIPDKRNFYDVINVDAEAMQKEMVDKKKRSSKKKFQCQQCYSGFSLQKLYERHITKLHSEHNKYECDACGIRYALKRRLTRHVNEHFRRFRCKLCGELYRDRAALYVHFKHGPHGRRMECKKCGATFDCTNSRKFFEHYRTTHGLLVCDHCGMRSSKKSRLIHHIRIRHSEIRCKICDVGFEKFYSLQQHNRRKHVVEATERNYCVECDLQFSNDFLYNEHVGRSAKHRVKPRIPCPECDKTYTKRGYMMNHYNLEHLKSSKYVCPICDRGFLNGYRMRNHVKYTHDKAPKPKNHICIHCGRGFNTRRILNNHVRTHTGERPYACAHCPAAFAQATALKTHERSAHK